MPNFTTKDINELDSQKSSVISQWDQLPVQELEEEDDEVFSEMRPAAASESPIGKKKSLPEGVPSPSST